MIKATFYEDGAGRVRRFRILNHGEALVCAGVSALAITCVNFIQSRFKPEARLKYEQEGGLIDFEPACGENREIGLVIDLLAFGLEQIREVYPNQIEIIRKGDYYD
ncbi:MAG: ribosomal-processing cysteine protease Prp [Clostridiales bacterium]|jgi:uncharacterized protein YsxB (DUF464 family)|nr:ribosomal-processing cysteine protease Prp [Clostridiales bacterium]